MNQGSQQIIVEAKDVRAQQFQRTDAIPSDGTVVYMTRLHPVSDQVLEVRKMRNLGYEIFHHYGNESIAWRDENTPSFSSLNDAVERVRQYQRAIVSHGRTARAFARAS